MLSASQEIQQQHGLPVISIVGLNDLLEYSEHDIALAQHRTALQNYREQFGVHHD